MPKNNVSDPITDQEMAFAHLVLSGTMKDRRLSLTQHQSAAPPAHAQVHTSEWLRSQQRQAEGTAPGDVVAAAKVQPAAPRYPEPESRPRSRPTTQRLSTRVHFWPG